MTKSITIIAMLLFFGINSFSQDDNEMWVKISPEITFRFEKSPIEIRWRPVDHIFLPEKYAGKNNFARTDIMFGVNIGKFKVFNYSKFDEFGRIWTGARLDFNTKALNKKLLINLQTRYFFGVNDKSKNHYYLIQYPRYMVTKKFHAGILSYGKWDPLKDFDQGNWFIGPSVQYMFPKGFSAHVAVAKDIFHEPVWMTFIRIAYKVKFKSKKETE